MSEINFISVQSVKARTVPGLLGEPSCVELIITERIHGRNVDTSLCITFAGDDCLEQHTRLAEAISPTLKSTLVQFVKRKEPA